LRNRAEFDRFLGKKVNVRYRMGDGEAVIEGALSAVDDAGFAVRGHRNEVLHLNWEDLIAARLVASL
jgi:ribosome maturation factor RimP